MKIIILLMALFMIGCTNMDNLSVIPSKTTVTYGGSTSTAEKDANNDVLTNTDKESWSIKQEFRWDNIKRRNR